MTLPPDLSQLGEHLELAAERAITRRRRRRALRTAVAATTAAVAFGAIEPADLAAPVRWATDESAIADLRSVPQRCVVLPTMRNEACRDWQAFVTDAATGRDSGMVLAYTGDATQLGSSDPRRPPGVRVVE